MSHHEDLLAALKQHFGFDGFKGNQEAIIENLMNGNDTFVLMPTGGGKSLCYQLPALLMDGIAIVISPLIALMKNQVDGIRSYSADDDIAHFINSSLSKAEIQSVRADISRGQTKLLYVAPESIAKEENMDFLKSIKISFYAVDEAHCISEWGHDFRPEYSNIRKIVDKIGKAPIIALTATATLKVQHDIQKNLGIPNAKVFKSSFNRPNLYYEIRKKTESTNRDLIKYIRSMEGKSGIIYCLKRKTVEELAQFLQVNGIQALPYHAGLDSEERTKNQDAFLMEKVQVIVATIAFGMGIDKPDVRFVIHYDTPKSLEGYYQETGRAGRDGGEGQCICYYSSKDVEKLRKFLQSKYTQNKDKTGVEQEIAEQLLREMQTYIESPICRRKLLLHYFGEEYNQDNCGNCDNCRKHYRMVDESEILQLALDTISKLKEKFKAEHIIDILKGTKSSAINAYKHYELENFGVAEDLDEATLQAIIREALIEGYIKRDIDSYGILKLTPQGKKYMKKPVEFKVPIEDPEDEDEDGGDIYNQVGASAAADEQLLHILKSLRKKISKQLGIPPFVIFQDPSLEAMATSYPITIDDLQNIPGVGQGKAVRYGEDFIKVIKSYVTENEIERPDDIRIRAVPRNSQTKIAIIQKIDRQIALDDIAIERGMSMDELLEEIEAIVNAGTKINIDYFLEEVMEPDKEEEIYDYFKNAETDDIKTALEELDEDDITETDVRLVRLKIKSELGI